MAAVRAALEQRLKSLELELHQVERLQRKFAMIHSTLAQQQGAKGEPDTPKLRQSEENPLNMSLRSSLPPGGANLKVGAGPGGRGARGGSQSCGFRDETGCLLQAEPRVEPGTRCFNPCRRPKTWARRPASWQAWTSTRAGQLGPAAACCPACKCGECGGSSSSSRLSAACWCRQARPRRSPFALPSPQVASVRQGFFEFSSLPRQAVGSAPGAAGLG